MAFTGVGRRTKPSGFTIVELLIVVVVIAILAAITIVGYTGIQQRANTSVILNSVDNWEKALRLVAVEGAPLPQGCLGNASDFPGTTDFSAGVCVSQDNGAATVSYNDAQYTAWPSYIQRPGGALPTSQFNGDGWVLKGRGMWVFNSNPSTRTIILAWVTQQQAGCGRGAPLFPTGGSTFQGYCGLIINY